MTVNALANEKKHFPPEQLLSQIEYLLLKDAETLNYDEVIELSNNIIIQREKYSNITLAKTYLLLAHVTSNKGELESALQFTRDGMAVAARHEKTKLDLQMKLASILAAKKQYQALLTSAQQAIDMSQNNVDTPYFLYALSYRSLAFAMLNQPEQALADLQKVTATIKEKPTFTQQATLLSALANAYYALGDYQTALTLQLKILALRFNLNKLGNVAQTYYHLANTYYRLQQYNDAYNAYWEARVRAEKKGAPIYVAYASQGLGLTLLQQKQYAKAEAETLKAKKLFYQHNLASSHLATLVTLTQISKATGQNDKAVRLLSQAEELLINTAPTDNYIKLYQLLADMYYLNKDIQKAYFWQKKYSNALLKINKPTLLISTHNAINTDEVADTTQNNQSSQLANELAEQSELTSSFSEKQQQQPLVYILFAVTSVLSCLVVLLWLKYRLAKRKNTDDTLAKTNSIITAPKQTKQLYQKHFAMARKYSYPLTLGYISISNWQELIFQSNSKVVAGVSHEIANLINEHLHEFDSAGLVNAGEYLLFFPHQHKADAEITMEKLISALKLRFFANLGKFSVTLTYSIESPTIQDIDPYIFLSHLSDSIKIA